MPEFQEFPAWRYGPGGKAAVFESEGDVPKGWKDHPSKVDGSAKDPEPVKTPAKQPEKSDELDADGHPFNPELHAATRSKTKAGLWRMKVGVARPAPAKPPLDL